VPCRQGALLLCHGLGRHDPSCAAWRFRTCDRFWVRDNQPVKEPAEFVAQGF
jgi:hypothetical protein